MPVSSCRRRGSLADVWCRQCGHASRFGQWVAPQDRCPHCAAPGAQRLPWALLRLQHPYLPLHPKIGHVYRPGK
ncbi:MAG: hypothetical protein JO250_15385 [Armatimonadetes bacterium]|nr:hypothetical protein [Armatimonadota bacterium]